MRYLSVSFTHKNTDICVREKLAFSSEEQKTIFATKLNSHPNINETIILSTCNRVEIITSVKECSVALDFIFDELSFFSGISKEELEGRGDIYEDNGAIHHLFSVASSLDSLVLGETQIMGQMKEAFRFSYENGLCGQKLSRAMHYAFRCSASVRSSTDISKNPVSVASVAVAKAKEICGDLDGESAIVIGAGEMSSIMAKHLVSNGAEVIILNRTLEKAQKLALEIGSGVRALEYASLDECVNKYKLIFTATSNTEPIITKNMVKHKNFDRYWFDVAVPRDIEEVDFSNVHIFAVDDLKGIVANNLALREEQARIAYSIVGRFTIDFFKWLQSLCVDPIIKQIRNQARECSLREVERAIKKGYLPKEYEEQVKKILHQAFNSFLHAPTSNLKEIAEKPQADAIAQAVQYIFDLNEEELIKLDSYRCEYQIENKLEL